MIAIVGVGAIGGMAAVHLQRVHGDLLCCARRHFDVLELHTPEAQLRSRPRVVTDPSGLAPVEWVLLATKAHQTPGAAPWLEALVGPETRLVVLQNGVEQVLRVAPWVPAERVVPVVVDCPASVVAPGRISQRREAQLAVPDDPSGRDFAALFAGTAVRVVPTPDWVTAAWRKLCINAVGGALAALSGRSLAEADHPRRGEMAQALARECGEVARAVGADVDPAFAEAVAGRATHVRSRGLPSILADRLAGRALEYDARNGAVVRFGARHGVATPVNARACALLADAHRSPGADLLPQLLDALG